MTGAFYENELGQFVPLVHRHLDWKPEDVPQEAVDAYGVAWQARKDEQAGPGQLGLLRVPGYKTRAGIAAALNTASLAAALNADDFEAWLKLGMEKGWVGPPVCVVHDGIPTTAEEDDYDEDDEPPCLHVIRPYTDLEQKAAVEANHSPSVWRQAR